MNRRRDIPFGFSDDADTLCQLKLMKKYHCSQKQVHRWRVELGIDTARRRDRPVVQIDMKTGKVIAHHQSISAGARAVGGFQQNVAQALSGRNRTAYGYAWRFDHEN